MVGSTTQKCNFAIVQQVTIEAIDDKNVSFTTRGMRVTGSTDQNLRKTFTVPLTEVYRSPIDGAPPPVEMIPGATGNLYLSRAGWGISTTDGYLIYGGAQAIFKYPECGAITTPPLTRLTVIPTSIVIRGHLRDKTALIDFELLGPDAAESQDIRWNGVDYVDVQLTARGARRVGIRSGPSTIEFWPTCIKIKGSPAIDQAVNGEVDVLDSELAACVQNIAFTKRHAPVTLSLTQDGVNAFHVTPQAAAEASSSGLVTPPLPSGPSRPARAGTRPGVTRRRSPA